MSDEPRPTRRLQAADETMSPVDLPGSALIGGRPLLWASTAIYLAALFLLLTNAAAIDGWAAELPPTALSARIVEVTGGWKEATGWLGQPRAVVHGWWTHAQDARFGGERSGG